MDRIRAREDRSVTPYDRANRWIENAWAGVRPWQARDDLLSTDMYETDEGLVIEVVLPGVDAEDVEISVMGDTLTIQGDLKRPDLGKVSYLAQERSYGAFRRTIQLPDLAPERISATMEMGILRLTLAKPEEERPHKITVKSAN
jgi:HSP20 family protein